MAIIGSTVAGRRPAHSLRFFFHFSYTVYKLYTFVSSTSDLLPQAESSLDPAHIHNRRTTLHHILLPTNGCVHPHVHPTLHSPAETS